MAYINFDMEKEEDVFDFVAYVMTYHNHVLQGYQDYQVILVGKVNINEEPGYYMITNDENVLFFTLTDNQTDMFVFIDKNYIDKAYLTSNESIILKYFKSFVYNLSGQNGDIISLFQFLNIANVNNQLLLASDNQTLPISDEQNNDLNNDLNNELSNESSNEKEEIITNIYEVKKTKKKNSTRKSNLIIAVLVVISLAGFAYYML